MTLSDIAALANDYTDENIRTNIIRGFVNTSLSRINAEIKTKLPLFDVDATGDEEYTALGSDWIHTIVIPYVCWSIKMNDGSLNEARMYEIQYRDGIELLKINKHKAIDKAYFKDGFENMYTLSNYKGMSGKRNLKGTSYDPLGQGLDLRDEDDD